MIADVDAGNTLTDDGHPTVMLFVVSLSCV